MDETNADQTLYVTRGRLLWIRNNQSLSGFWNQTFTLSEADMRSDIAITPPPHLAEAADHFLKWRQMASQTHIGIWQRLLSPELPVNHQCWRMGGMLQTCITSQSLCLIYSSGTSPLHLPLTWTLTQPSHFLAHSRHAAHLMMLSAQYEITLGIHLTEAVGQSLMDEDSSDTVVWSELTYGLQILSSDDLWHFMDIIFGFLLSISQYLQKADCSCLVKSGGGAWGTGGGRGGCDAVTSHFTKPVKGRAVGPELCCSV